MVTKETAEAIKKSYSLSDKRGYRSVARDFNVSWKVVYNIVNFDTYHKTPDERFWDKVDKGDADDCWNWNASLSTKGYGHIGWEGKVVEAHRIAYLLYYGKHPGELHVLHKCDNPKCCNPRHLRLGTHQDNMRDMAEKHRAPRQQRKLTMEQAQEIRDKYKSGGYTLRALADEYGVSKRCIDGIIYNRTYTHD